jgi:S1-C subfamily serine protease
MFKYFYFTLFFGLFLLSSFSQNDKRKIYFDKSGKTCSEGTAYYFRQQTDTTEYYRSFYASNNKMYFQGAIASPSDEDESKNVYRGICNWYFKNGNVKYLKTYSDKGLEIGTSKYYYESGKIWKEIELENGKIKNSTYSEYNEDGTRNVIFEETFSNNYNEWDLYMSDKSLSTISNGFFEIVSTSKEGTSRYINIPVNSKSYAVEATLNVKDLKEGEKVGLLYGFKDWQNYHYFAISKKGVYIGSVYEGINSTDVDAMFSSNIKALEDNSLKIICNGEKNYFSINGEIQYTCNQNKLYGNNFGFIVSGKSKTKIDDFIVKGMDAGKASRTETSPSDANIKATGSGVLLSSSGYFITNHHVVDHSSTFLVEINENSNKKTYSAVLITQDKENDLAILKIKDDSFEKLPPLKYSFKESGQLDVGATAFTIGYPLALNGMGKEAKFTDGKISAKTGYDGAINSFQTTIPVQPGNSGGPVFNNDGQLIGLINASIRNADNVSYAIKLNYIKNLIELLPDKLDLPTDNTNSALSLEEKIKVLTNYVVLVKVK